MISDKLKELAAAKAKLAKLEASVAADLRVELGGLPAKYGFTDLKSFFQAVEAANRSRPGRKPAAEKPVSIRKRRKRAKITDATRAELKKLVAAGKTGEEVAKTLGISPASVQNIKKALGLVKKK